MTQENEQNRTNLTGRKKDWTRKQRNEGQTQTRQGQKGTQKGTN